MIASMADEIVETIEQKLARYESVIGLQMEEITRLRAVVAKLTEVPMTLIRLCAVYIWTRHSLRIPG